ncbi:MAG: flagellar protein FlaG [Negativicutes bacterium]|nr:flagellar protein FlaG [Negativicutes bacterium]
MEVNSTQGLNILVGSLVKSASTSPVLAAAGQAGADRSEEAPSEASSVQGGLQQLAARKPDDEQLKKEVDERMKTMNKLFRDIGADLRFGYHDGAEQLMVQFVDSKENKVLHEYPPKEFLDNIARIRRLIGLFIDHKI